MSTWRLLFITHFEIIHQSVILLFAAITLEYNSNIIVTIVTAKINDDNDNVNDNDNYTSKK